MARIPLKKKALAAAIVAALAGGVASRAQADVFVNSDGTGQVLVYPYWTVNEGTSQGITGAYDTLVSIVNSTDEVHAVKVRFLEYKNSWEVLDFNLYLSAHDVWTAAVTNNNGIGHLETLDQSCTAPEIPAGGQDFLPFAINDAEGVTPDRLAQGHIELIDMGVVTNATSVTGFNPATWATHGPGQSCDKLVAAFADPNEWGIDTNVGVNPPTGGLFGAAALINVPQGLDFSYAATALDGAYDTAQQTAPGEVTPTLDQALPFSIVFASPPGGGLPTAIMSDWTNTGLPGINAVSAVFMHHNIMNEFVLDDITNSGTDWVVTFPTKRSYVNPGVNPPFTTTFGPLGACESVGLTIWNREEQTTTTPPQFSPRPPVGRDALCWETNVITFNKTKVFASPSSLNVSVDTSPTADPRFENGWMRLTFNDTNQAMTDAAGVTYNGLPAIGFMGATFFNGDVGGLLSNYGGLVPHRYAVLLTGG